MNRLIEFLVRRSILGNIVTIGIVAAGIFALSQMNREAFPNVNFDIVSVVTFYPGASPQEVEKLITIPIERELKPVNGIKKSSSTSIESQAAIGITLEPDVEDKSKVIQDIKDAVDKAKVDFPDDAEEPSVIEIETSRQGIIEIAMGTREGKLSELELREYADQLADQIELLDDVAIVDKRGYRDREIHVEIFPDKLEYYNISPDEISSALKNRNLNFPGGNITQGGVEYGIRTVKEFQNLEEIKNLIIRANDLGGVVRVKDVADVQNDFEEIKVLEKANGRPAIILTALKKEKGDAIDLVEGIFKKIDEFKKTAPADLRIETFNDLSFYIKRRIGVLVNNVAIGLALVALCLLFFLGWRVSLMVAIGMPFAFAITFLLMNQFGISINLISMFGLIIAVGMVVDDAIIVGENIYRHLEDGVSTAQAAIMGAKEMVVPVFGAISTTCVAFLPLMFMDGIMGKFVWVLPAAVIIALAASLIESFFILPAHIADISQSDVTLHHGEKQELGPLDRFSLGLSKVEKRLMGGLQKVYVPVLRWVLKFRYLVLLMVLGLFVVAIGLIGQIGFKLFPKEGIEILLLRAEADSGTNLEEMNARIRPIEEAVSGLYENELDSFTTRIGIHQKDPNDPFTKRGKNYAQITVFLTPESKRSRKAKEIVSYLTRKVNPERPIYALVKAEGVLSPEIKNPYLRVDNSSEIKFFSLDAPKDILQKLKVHDEFLFGGGLIPKTKTFIGYAANNELFYFDVGKKEKIESHKVSLKKYDFPTQFLLEPEAEFGLLLTEQGFLYKLNLKNGKKERLKKYNDGITSISFSREKTQKIKSGLILLAFGGGVELWRYEGDSIELVKEINKAPKFDLAKKRLYENKLLPMSRVEYASYSPEKEEITVATFSGMLRVYSLNQSKFIENYKVSDEPVFWCMRAQENGKYIWFSKKDTLLRYDIQKKEVSYDKIIVGNITHALKESSTGFLFGTFGSIVETNHSNSTLAPHREGYRAIEKIDFDQMGGGPPIGAPVQIEIRGDEFDTSLKIAEKIKNILNTIDGVYDIRDNWEEGKEEFHVQIDEERAAIAGINVAQIALSLQTAFEGSVSTSIKRADEEIDIRVIFPDALRENLSSLQKVKVRNKFGRLVSITELATFKKYPGVPVISHADFKRTIYVQANLNEAKTSSVAVNQKVLEQTDEIAKDYPGYEIVAGGEFEDTQESMGGLVYSGMFALLGIGMILVLLFGNLRSPRVIMAAIPLGLIGVAVAFFIHKLTFLPNLVFSFLASMGIVGLTGVVVNDSIVLVDFITKLRHFGIGKIEAIMGGCITRLRPVMLTTITTVFGLLPTAYGLGGDDPFLKPMALALAWGLAFASAITLLIIPAYYAVWEDKGFIFHHIKAAFPGLDSELLRLGRNRPETRKIEKEVEVKKTDKRKSLPAKRQREGIK